MASGIAVAITSAVLPQNLFVEGADEDYSMDHLSEKPSTGLPSPVATYRPPATPLAKKTGSPFRGCSPVTIVADP